MKKVIKKKNIYFKCVNNHKIQIRHKFITKNHNVNGELSEIYLSMQPIYQDIDEEFMSIDLMDLEFYERWLNE